MIGLAGILALLGVSPVCAQDYRDYLCRETRQPFFRAQGGPEGPRRVTTRRRLAHPIAFEVPKPPRTRRILVVGESVAAILWEAEGDAVTEAGRRAWPGWSVEHVNAGMTAYNSRRIAAVLEEALAYEPDLAIVLSGNNEHDGLELCPSLWEGVERRFRRSTAFRALEKAFAGKPNGREYERRASLARHEWQLRRMVQAARERSVPIFLATLPPNERDYPPWGEAPWASAAFARGMERLEAGSPEEASLAFGRRLSEEPGDAFAHWYLARALDASGRPEQAREHFAEAVERDARGDRSSRGRNAMIRRVAAEEGAGLADLEAAFRSAAPGGVIGGERLADGVHWYPRFNRFAAAALLSSVRRSSHCAALGPWDAQALERFAREAAAAQASPERRREELKKVLLYGIRNASYWAATDRLGAVNELPVVLFERVDREDRAWLLELSRGKSALRAQLVKNYWVQDLAEDLDQWWPVYLLHLGEMYRRKGEAALALRFLDQALALSPGRRRVRLWRSLALRALGRDKAAAAELAKLGESDPVVGAVRKSRVESTTGGGPSRR
ncbi:MAG: hypothetical protein HY554_09575 [Elusimicrobia bacterium]|nr:hypothetical protein [Elusimicrobiota bacterium]